MLLKQETREWRTGLGNNTISSDKDLALVFSFYLAIVSCSRSHLHFGVEYEMAQASHRRQNVVRQKLLA